MEKKPKNNKWSSFNIFINAFEPVESTLDAHYQKNKIAYHSKRDPIREAHRQLSSVSKNMRHLILIGAGLGYLIEIAVEKYSSVLLIEPDPKVLSMAMQRLDVNKLKDKLKIYAPQNIATDTLEDILGYLQGKNIHTIQILPFRAAFQAMPQLYVPILDRLKELFERRSVNQATIVKFQDLWNRNVLLNLTQLTRAASYSEIKNSTSVNNIVIAGAGPSLHRSIPALKKHRSKFLLAAADTSLIPLARAGVIPDVVFAADPQSLNRYFSYCKEANEVLWILDPVVSYGLVSNIQNAKIANWDNPFKIYTLFSKVFGDRGEVRHGGSVSTNAFDFACSLAKEKIILVGQDFAFSGGMAHTKGAALESLKFATINRWNTNENHNYKQLSALPKIPMPAISYNQNEKQTTITNAKLKIIFDWFVRNAQANDQKLINATHSGAHLTNWKHKPLEEVLAACSAQPTPDFSDFIKTPNPKKIESLKQSLGKLTNDLNSISRICKKALQTNSVNNLEKDLARFPEAKDIAGLGAQSTILKITELGEDVKPKEFLAAIDKSARETILLLEKALHAL